MCYPGLNSSSKMHLFRSVCQPTLMYGVKCLTSSSSKHVHILNSAQGSVVKHVSGLSVRARHTALLQALDIYQAGDYIKKSTLSLYNRICSQDSPTHDLCMYFTQMYISSGIRVPGSLVDRVIDFGASPSERRERENLFATNTFIHWGPIHLYIYILIIILSHQPMNLTEWLTHYEQCY